jgi:hypothetical protein
MSYGINLKDQYRNVGRIKRTPMIRRMSASLQQQTFASRMLWKLCIQSLSPGLTNASSQVALPRLKAFRS